ncbi:MAG: tetratricopeptide repeat protein [Verrucomicrobiales bacterium]
MIEQSSKSNNRVGGWLWLAVLAGSLATLKRFADFEAWETRALMVTLSVLGLLKLLWLFRQQTTSLRGVAAVLLSVVAAGAISFIGIPSQARHLPSFMDLMLVVVPLLLFVAAVVAGLIGLAKWRGPGEFSGVSSNNRLLVALNLILAATAWQVVRHAPSQPVLKGLVSLPHLQTQRNSVERMVDEMMGDLGPYQAAPSLANFPSDPVNGMVGPTGLVRPVSLTTEPWERARDAERRGDREAAAKAWVEAADAAGHDPVVEATAIRALMLAQLPSQALVRVERLRGAGFDSPDLDLLYGFLLANSGRLVEAINIYEPALLANYGSDDEVRRYLGILVELGETARALHTTERLLIKRPNRRIHRWRACLQAAEGDYDSALATLRRLTLTTPFDPLDAYRLGEVANDAGRPQVALAAVTALIKAGESTPRTTKIAAHAYAALGLPLSATRESGSTGSPIEQRAAGALNERLGTRQAAGGS